jgi:predicted RNase H-like nuclease (RuvC/YqgF family)
MEENENKSTEENEKKEENNDEVTLESLNKQNEDLKRQNDKMKTDYVELESNRNRIESQLSKTIPVLEKNNLGHLDRTTGKIVINELPNPIQKTMTVIEDLDQKIEILNRKRNEGDIDEDDYIPASL